MGLDNGFILRNKTTNKDVELFSFRNYYALANFFRTGDETEYEVSEQQLTDLLHQLKPVYEELKRLPMNTVGYYDDHGYPDKYCKLFYGSDFNPTDSESSFGGYKLMKLYNRVEALLEIMENIRYSDCSDEYCIIFYDSY